MKVLVPLLNKWLGGFQGNAHTTVQGQQEVVDAVKMQKEGDGDEIDVACDDPGI